MNRMSSYLCDICNKRRKTYNTVSLNDDDVFFNVCNKCGGTQNWQGLVVAIKDTDYAKTIAHVPEYQALWEDSQ